MSATIYRQAVPWYAVSGSHSLITVVYSSYVFIHEGKETNPLVL